MEGKRSVWRVEKSRGTVSGILNFAVAPRRDSFFHTFPRDIADKRERIRRWPVFQGASLPPHDKENLRGALKNEYRSFSRADPAERSQINTRLRRLCSQAHSCSDTWIKNRRMGKETR